MTLYHLARNVLTGVMSNSTLGLRLAIINEQWTLPLPLPSIQQKKTCNKCGLRRFNIWEENFTSIFYTLAKNGHFWFSSSKCEGDLISDISLGDQNSDTCLSNRTSRSNTPAVGNVRTREGEANKKLNTCHKLWFSSYPYIF